MEVKKIRLPFNIKNPVLAVGSQTKNTICFVRNNLACLSPLHANLSSPKDFLAFQKDIKYFLKKHPKVIACDLHDDYQSTKYAISFLTGYPLVLIQHHHAHIASAMAENGLKNKKVIGVAFDGTGLGDDKTLWGAEFLVCDYKNFTRKAHLREIPLLGGEKAILEPARLAAAWLYFIYKDKFLNLKNIALIRKIDREKWRVLKHMYLAGLNVPLASSMGRLFDAVGALVLEKDKVNFEAELAIELQKTAANYGLAATKYKFQVFMEKKKYILDPRPMFKEIIRDLAGNAPQEKIAYRFHLTVAQMTRKICLGLRKETKINQVVLSGGVFQNNLLLHLSLDLLYKEGFKVFMHKNLSCNDSGISFGQALIANFRS
jgi:hydrogenase maturation protein HypF